ncbi:MAG TPA: chloride channel protein [Rectinemataceae bacterium]|nr:chloride channel protein [Rectinemataceae bacterium]
MTSSLAVGLLLNKLAPEAAGSGIPQLKAAYWKELGYVPIKPILIKFVAGAIGIGGGASLGREGPTVYMGGGVASNLSAFLGSAKRERRGSSLVGASAGLAEKYKQKLAVKDFEATTKYRFDPKFETGGTFGVNYASIGGRLIAFNYRTCAWTEGERSALHERLILGHYLRQFNEETIATRSQATCGEPCAAVCKKLRGEFKKDYEPYQALGPLIGIFDQRAAEAVNRVSDAAGFDAISLGGLLAWLMDLLDRGELSEGDLGVTRKPRWIDGPGQADFDAAGDSRHNAELALELISSILARRGILDLSEGPRKWARRVRKMRGTRILDRFVYTANGRKGWMVPNQYWTPGVLAPMAIMGKYYMHYGPEFLPPRELGRACAKRLEKELGMDNAGLCRFHRAWGEEMMAEAVGSVYGLKDEYLAAVSVAASRINSRNAAVYWESAADVELVSTFLRRRRDVEGDASPELARWIAAFDADPSEAALSWWFETRKGIDESLRDFM